MLKVKILDRYLLGEVLPPLGAGLASLTFALVAARLPRLIELIINHGLGLIEILRMMGYIVPSFLEATFPMTILLGVLLGFGRLSGDQELTAIRACGVSLYRLAAPIMVFALVAFPLECWLAFDVRPWANRKLGAEIYRVISTQAMAGLKEKIFNDHFPGLLMYVDDIRPPATTMSGVMITDSRDPGHPSTIIARSGVFVPDEARRQITLRLVDGSVFGADPKSEGYHYTSFRFYDVAIRPIEHMAAFVPTGAKEMGYHKLKAEIAAARRAGKPDFVAETELARKFSAPFATVLFAVLGVSLGIKPARAGQSERFALSVALFFLYFILMRVGQSLAEAGRVSAAVAMAFPDVGFELLAARLFYRAANDRTDNARGPGDVVWDIITRLERRGAAKR